MITASGGAQYVNDALDQRVEKTGGSNRSDAIYLAGVPIALVNPSNGAYADLTYANSELRIDIWIEENCRRVPKVAEHRSSANSLTH